MVINVGIGLAMVDFLGNELPISFIYSFPSKVLRLCIFEAGLINLMGDT